MGLHYVTMVDRMRHLSQELCNALWHHLMQQQLDEKKLAQYSLYGPHGRDDKETKEDVVRGSEGD